LCALANRRPGWGGETIYVEVRGCRPARKSKHLGAKERPMNRIVYIVGAIVIIIALLSFFGLR
jgi:predicted membrane channel-forming protein YqfA (hemolysin III family)